MQRTLFDKITLGTSSVTSQNRIMRSPTWEYSAGPNGEMTPELAEIMVELARHHVGIIGFSFCFVSEAGRLLNKQLGIQNAEVAESYRKVVSDIKALGSVPMLQLVHGGRFAMGSDRVGPSGTELTDVNGKPLPQCREASKEDIDHLVKEFVDAAVRSRDVGFEAVMLHACHLTIISQFLNPMHNTRTDEYGGSLENRARFLLTIVREMKKALGNEFPIAVKLNTDDTLPAGQTLTIEESAQVAAWLAEAGVCLVEASGGGLGARYRSSRTGKDAYEGFHREGARLWKKAIKDAGYEGKTLVALVGGIRSGRTAVEFLNDGSCDVVSVARPLIREPDLVEKWMESVDYKAKCASCNGCFTLEKFGCIFNQKK